MATADRSALIEIDRRVDELMLADDRLTVREAVVRVFSEDRALYDEYRLELLHYGSGSSPDGVTENGKRQLTEIIRKLKRTVEGTR